MATIKITQGNVLRLSIRLTESIQTVNEGVLDEEVIDFFPEGKVTVILASGAMCHKYEAEMADIRGKRKEVLLKAKEEAADILDKSCFLECI